MNAVATKQKHIIGDAEKYAWSCLIATGVVLFHFFDRMHEGWTMIDQSATQLLWTYGRVVIMFIILHIVIAILFAARRDKNTPEGELFETDERDEKFKFRAERFGFWALIIFVELGILFMLVENAFGSPFGLPISLATPSHLLFGLLGAVLFAEMVKQASLIVSYRL